MRPYPRISPNNRLGTIICDAISVWPLKTKVGTAWLFVILSPEMQSRFPVSRNAKMKRETDLGLCEMPSRRTKSIKIFWKRQNEAGNRSKSPKSHFLRRETGKILRKVISRGGKGEKCLGKRLRAAGRRLKVSEIGFARREKEDNLAKRLSAAE